MPTFNSVWNTEYAAPPTQPSNPTPYCVTRATDPPGTIVPAGQELQFEGDGTYRGRFGPKSLRMTIRRPRKTGFYYSSVTFKGSPYVRAGVDPYPLLLTKTSKQRVGFADPQVFPACPGYKP